MKILITGGTGFIGSYVLKQLTRAGHLVTAVRRPGSQPVIELDREPIWLDKKIRDLTISDLSGVDAVLHLASAGVSPKEASWDEHVSINIGVSIHLIEQAHQAGVRRFVAAGTCHEYGEEANAWDRIPPHACLRPYSPYGAAKAAGFMMLNAHCRQKNTELVYCRIFSAFGEGQFSSNLWPSLRSAAMQGLDFQMTTGEQVLDFIPVEDVATHLVNSTFRDDVKPGIPLVLNIGTGIGKSVADFAQEQWDSFGASGKLLLGAIPSRLNHAPKIVADPTGLLFSQQSSI